MDTVMNPNDEGDHIEEVPRYSYAQNMEDILLDRMFEGQVGTYMDIGANHPTIESNTQFFYLRGWRGVNLEPIPRNHAFFLQDRPDDLNLAVAASDFEGSMPFFEIANTDGLTGHSTLSAEVAEQHRNPRFGVVEYEVPVRTIASLIEQYHIEPPDFLSIDVEGHEHRVIRGIPLDRWRPKVLVIESLVPLEHLASHVNWEPTLLENSYVFAAFNGVNRFYLRSDLSEKLPLLQTPVNVLDHFKTRETFQLEIRIQQLDRQLAEAHVELAAERAQLADLRAGWELGLSQSQQAQVKWERACAGLEEDRRRWSDTLSALEQARADWKRERENILREWERERAYYQQLLTATQTELRPYRLIDRLGVVSAGYGWARRLKRKFAS
jgi:FkbM family methyltransferase